MTDPPFATVRLKRFFLKPSCFNWPILACNACRSTAGDADSVGSAARSVSCRLPLGNLVRVNFELLRELRQGFITRQRSHGNLGFESR